MSILKVSEAAALGFHATVMTAETDDKISTASIARQLKASEAHLSKVMRCLVKAGIVESATGPHGGFKLANKPEKIRLIDVYNAVEGKFPSVNCLFAKPVCKGKSCILGDFIGKINAECLEYFEKTTIRDLIHKGEVDL
jgi:Rrf2 family protein